MLVILCDRSLIGTCRYRIRHGGLHNHCLQHRPLPCNGAGFELLLQTFVAFALPAAGRTRSSEVLMILA
jgi:hypothetical protein